MNRPTRILCLGGGWAAFELARALKHSIRRKEVELTVISRAAHLATHGLMAELITCKVRPQQMISPLEPLLAPATLLNMNVEKIDLDAKTVCARSASDGCLHTLHYDQLVLALGSVDDPAQAIEGADQCFSLKTFEDGCRLRSHLLKVFEAARAESDPSVRRELLTFVVAGGNYTGIEVACELIDFIKQMLPREIVNDPAAGPRVIVIEKGPRILSDLADRAPHMAHYAERQVKRLGVQVRTGSSVVKVCSCGAVLADGAAMQARTVIRCTGTAASPLVANLPLEHDAHGRIVTDEFMRANGAPGIWAAGDCAAVPHPAAGTCPPMALFAREGGRLIGRNILRALHAQPLLPYRFTGLGEACTLGHRCAVAQMKGVPAYGLAAWLGWRLIVWTMFAPAWPRKLRLAQDWLVAAVAGRDIANPPADGALQKRMRSL